MGLNGLLDSGLPTWSSRLGTKAVGSSLAGGGAAFGPAGDNAARGVFIVLQKSSCPYLPGFAVSSVRQCSVALAAENDRVATGFCCQVCSSVQCGFGHAHIVGETYPPPHQRFAPIRFSRFAFARRCFFGLRSEISCPTSRANHVFRYTLYGRSTFCVAFVHAPTSHR